ncbi:hypothetical protein [Arthrobacter castelli]|uniref:hypothetical protein n=1 Tax=Arthrobacter castelli TaxID=271431 RepID=UPI00047AEDBE|nr:hypothetical protein [Arthrobacter castelli]
MSLRSRLRDDFPAGWWHCRRWWTDGGRELGLWLVAITVTVMLLARVVTALRCRRRPVVLARINGEAFVAAGLANSIMVIFAVIALTTGPAARDRSWLFALVAFLALCVLNLLVASVMVAVLAVSRLTNKFEWSVIDYIDRHGVRGSAPPQTCAEYEAERMRDFLGGR